MFHFLITGATSGIGAAVLELLSLSNIYYPDKSKLKITLVGRGEEKLKQTADLYKNTDINYLIIDLQDPLSIEEALKDDLQNLKNVNRLIYSAGQTRIEGIRQLSVKRNMEILNINYLSFVELLRVIILNKPAESKLSAVAVSALAATTGAPYTDSYSAAKKALEVYIKNSSLELFKYNTIVNAVAPAYVDTPMLKFNRLINKNFDDSIKSIQPLGLISPEAAAKEILNLLESDCCAGTIRFLNAGMQY